LFADFVPALRVGLFVFCNFQFRRVQRKVGGVEREIKKPRLAGRFARVRNKVERVIAEDIR